MLDVELLALLPDVVRGVVAGEEREVQVVAVGLAAGGGGEVRRVKKQITLFQGTNSVMGMTQLFSQFGKVSPIKFIRV